MTIEEKPAMPGRIDKVLADKKIELPKAAIPVANYVPVTIAGNLAVVSGQVSARSSRSSRASRRPGSAPSTCWRS
jgi:enamine deaminase RidA (YjgF/YER057c/UK114 family)